MNIKYILTFIIGAAAGVGGSAWFFKTKYETVYRKKADEELAEMDEYYKSIIESNIEKSSEEEIPETIQEEYKPEPEVKEEKPSGHPKQKRQGSFATDYTKFYGNIDPAEKESPVEEEPPVVREKQQPRIIKASDYGTGGYAKRVLYYYTDDDELYPEGENYDEVIDADEVTDMIGNALTKYGFTEPSNMERNIFVRNFDRKTDYQVVKTMGSRKDEYGG